MRAESGLAALRRSPVGKMEVARDLRYLLLAVFGLMGIFARYGLNSLTLKVFGSLSPVTTAAINIFGSFAIEVCYVLSTDKSFISEDLRIALMSGLLGGFTTFSAFSLETVAMFAAGRHVMAGTYIAATVAGGIMAALGGIYLAKLL